MSNETTKLYICNLSWDASETDLNLFFNLAGYKLLDVRIIRHPETGRSKGFGFVSFADNYEVGDSAIAQCERAVKQFEGHEFMGRPLHVDFALDKQGRKERHIGQQDDRRAERREKRTGRSPRVYEQTQPPRKDLPFDDVWRGKP